MQIYNSNPAIDPSDKLASCSLEILAPPKKSCCWKQLPTRTHFLDLLHLGGNHVTKCFQVKALQCGFILIGSSASLFSWLGAEDNVSLG